MLFQRRIALRREAAGAQIDRRPARLVVEQRAVLVEQDAAYRRDRAPETGITSTLTSSFWRPGPTSTPSSGETSA